MPSKLADRGGYVWVESRVRPGVAKVGLVEMDTAIDIDDKARWEIRDNEERDRQTGDTAVLKTLRLQKVRYVDQGQQMGLRAGRPQQGTIRQWHKCGTRLADVVEGRPSPPEWSNLSTEQQEAACAEFLRLQQTIEGLPALKYLLLPVGRTLEDVDIYGLADDGREIFAQVTHADANSKLAQDKVARLKKCGSGDAHLIFFGTGSGSQGEQDFEFVSVEAVMDWLAYDSDYRAALFPKG